MNDISYYLSLPYTKVLRRDDEGDVVASIAELDGCIAHGSDEAEALRNLRDALAAWLESALDGGQAIPPPEIQEELPSGKFVVRLPRSLHQKLNRLAKRDDVSLNQVMVVAATEHLARQESRQHSAAYEAPNWQDWITTIDWQRTGHLSTTPKREFRERLRTISLAGKDIPESHAHARTGR